MKVVGGTTVIPGAHILLFQKNTTYIFAQKDAGHVDKSPSEYRNAFQLLHDGGQKSGASVDWEHPEGRVASQFQITYTEGVQAGPE